MQTAAPHRWTTGDGRPVGAGGGEANKPPPGDANPRARQANTYTWLAEKALDCCLHPVKTTNLWRRGREKNEDRSSGCPISLPSFLWLLSGSGHIVLPTASQEDEAETTLGPSVYRHTLCPALPSLQKHL